MMLDYTFERQIQLERQEGWKEGYKEGYTEGSILKGKILAYYDMNLSPKEIAVKLNLTEDIVNAVIQKDGFELKE